MSLRFTLLILIALFIAACVPATPESPAGPTPTFLPPTETPAPIDVAEAGRRTVEPPPASLTIGGQEQTSGIGTYCWAGGTPTATGVQSKVCEDTIGIPTPQEPLVVQSPFEARLRLPLEEPPDTLSMRVVPVTEADQLEAEALGWRWWPFQDGESHRLPLERRPTVELSLEPGLYVLSVSGFWHSIGDVNYRFLVGVTESATAQPPAGVATTPTPAAPAPTVKPEVSFELMAQYGGRAQAVAVEGGIAYLGIGPYLLALNVGDPAEPRRLGRSRLLSGIVEDLAVANDKVYAAAGDAGLRVIDVTDPTRPRGTGGVRLLGHAEHLVVHENVAYVVTTQDRSDTESSDLHVVDLTDAAAPRQVAVVALLDQAYAILLDDNYLYVAHESGLSIFDVTEPAQPREIALVPVGGPAYDVAVAGNTAYVPSEDLVVINVSNPAGANIVGRWKGEPPEELDTIAVVGDRLYTYGSFGEWGYIFIDGYVLDISDPAAPQEVGRASLAWEDVAVQGTRLFTAAGAGLHIWNLEEPGEFTPVGQFRPDQPAYVGELTLAGRPSTSSGRRHAFAATDDGIGIFDVYDPAAIRPISTITGTAFVNELALAGDTLLVSSWRDGLSAFDVADPAAPRPLEVTDSRLRRGGTDDLALAGDHALVAVDDGLLTVDLSAPQALRVSGQLYVDSDAGTRIAAEGDYAYYLTATVPTGGTTTEYSTLHVVDVSRPTAPQVVGSVDIPVYAQDVAVKEGHAFAVGEVSRPACCSGWLIIVDVTQPAAPRQVARIDLPAGAYAAHLEGHRAYVAAGASGLWVFDVSRPAAPRAIGHVDTPGEARHVTVQGDTVYVSDGAGGLLVLSQAAVSEEARREATVPEQAPEPTPTRTPVLTQMKTSEWSSTRRPELVEGAPDGQWIAQGMVAFPKAGGDDYYTRLKVARTDGTVEWTVVDKWSDWGLGYTTPQPFHWSRDGRYFYFTNRPVPDGCGIFFVNGSDLHKVDLSDGSVTQVVPPSGLWLSLSPDETRLAYIGRGLVVRDLETGAEQAIELNPGKEYAAGHIVWSPDGTALMLTLAIRPSCSTNRAESTSIVRVDFATLEPETLIREDPRLFVTVKWPAAGQVLLVDEEENHWWMDATTGEVRKSK